MTLKHNGPLADKIKTWIAGENFSERQSNVPKRRRRHRSAVEPCAEIHFVIPLASFSRTVPLSLSVEDLYRVAFQGMKGLHVSFNLRHKGGILHACQKSIQEAGISNKSTIHVDLNANRKSSIPDKNEKVGTKVESEELALVKVYQDDQHIFSFWISRQTKQSLASIVFRLWRYRAENKSRSEDHDVEFWTNIRHVGDDHRSGSRWEHWQTLLSLLMPGIATGILEDEGSLENEPTQETKNIVCSNFFNEKILVLKLLLYRYKPRKHEQKAKRAKKFSRVGL